MFWDTTALIIINTFIIGKKKKNQFKSYKIATFGLPTLWGNYY